jgi:hypothetical protein
MNQLSKQRKHFRNTDTSLTEETRRRLFALMHERGLDEDARHDVQRSVIGKESLKDFTEAEGRELVAHLLSLGRSHADGKPLRRKYTRTDGITEINAVPTVTQAQIRMMYALMHRIVESEEQKLAAEQKDELSQKPENWSDNIHARLDGWTRRVSNNEANRLEELMLEEASNLIEALKSLVDRTEQQTQVQSS